MMPAIASARVDAWRAAAVALARELAADAVWDGDLCAFHGAVPGLAIGDPQRYGSMGADVYQGSAGIARFLSYAAALTGDPRIREVALGAIRHALNTVRDWPLYTGAAGVGAVALELADVLGESDLRPLGLRELERAGEDALAAEAPCDLLVGTAGVVIGLLGARPHDRDGRLLARAVDLGRLLLRAAVDSGSDCEDGPALSWHLSPGSAERLCGLAHGASGVAFAFECLSRATCGDDRWSAAARQARAFERMHYSAELGSWADLRSPENGGATASTSYPHMWCHGSVGIAAERLRASRDDLLARADVVGGLAGAAGFARQLIAGPLGPGGGDAINGSLCHGLAGLIDLFVDAWRVTGDASWQMLAGEIGDLMLNDSRRPGGWRCGLPGGHSTPGLFLGLAGIGWALLRLSNPDRVASTWLIGSPL